MSQKILRPFDAKTIINRKVDKMLNISDQYLGSIVKTKDLYFKVFGKILDILSTKMTDKIGQDDQIKYIAFDSGVAYYNAVNSQQKLTSTLNILEKFFKSVDELHIVQLISKLREYALPKRLPTSEYDFIINVLTKICKKYGQESVPGTDEISDDELSAVKLSDEEFDEYSRKRNESALNEEIEKRIKGNFSLCTEEQSAVYDNETNEFGEPSDDLDVDEESTELTQMDLAVQNNDLDAVRNIIKSGEYVPEDVSALVLAIQYDNFEIFNELLSSFSSIGYTISDIHEAMQAARQLNKDEIDSGGSKQDRKYLKYLGSLIDFKYKITK